MAYTNKTTNYELPQYIGTDKPTYLSDFNGAMNTIDAQMKINADNASSASSSASSASQVANNALNVANGADTKADTALTNAGTAQTTADTAQSVATSALSTANTANSKADTAQTTADTASANASSALSKADAIANKLNLTTFETIEYTSMTKTGGGNLTGGTIYTAVNGDGSIGKIYGQIDVKTNGSSGNVTIPTQLRPKDASGQATDLTINGLCIRVITEGASTKNLNNISVSIGSNGNVKVGYISTSGTNENCRFMFMACVLFLTPFNDTPIPEE